jgi:hypothetical protein
MGWFTRKQPSFTWPDRKLHSEVADARRRLEKAWAAHVERVEKIIPKDWKTGDPWLGVLFTHEALAAALDMMFVEGMQPPEAYRQLTKFVTAFNKHEGELRKVVTDYQREQSANDRKEAAIRSVVAFYERHPVLKSRLPVEEFKEEMRASFSSGMTEHEMCAAARTLIRRMQSLLGHGQQEMVTGTKHAPAKTGPVGIDDQIRTLEQDLRSLPRPSNEIELINRLEKEAQLEELKRERDIIVENT